MRNVAYQQQTIKVYAQVVVLSVVVGYVSTAYVDM